MSYLLDTNAFNSLYDTSVAKNHPGLCLLAQRCLEEGGEVAISWFTYYEALRGIHKLLLQNQGLSKRNKFERLLRRVALLPVPEHVWPTAAEYWARLQLQGRKASDGDLLIATTAIVLGRKLVSSDMRLLSALDALGLSAHVATF